MKCPNCQSVNTDDAMFCMKCGSALSGTPAAPIPPSSSVSTSSVGFDKIKPRSRDISSTLILIWVITFAVFQIMYYFLPMLFDALWADYRYSKGLIVYMIVGLMSNLSNLLIPLSVRNTIVKVIGIIIVCLIACVNLGMSIYHYLEVREIYDLY